MIVCHVRDLEMAACTSCGDTLFRTKLMSYFFHAKDST